jgi:hypothetical protein
MRRDSLPSDDDLVKALDDFIGNFASAAPLGSNESPAADACRPFVLTHAVVGAIQTAVLTDSSHLGTSAFEDEVLRLVEGSGAALSARFPD